LDFINFVPQRDVKKEMLKFVKYLFLWLSWLWLSILVAVLFDREAELARASSEAVQGVAFWSVKAGAAMGQGLAAAGQISLAIADHSGIVLASAVGFIGHNAAESILFTGRVLAATVLFAGGALSGSLNYLGFVLSHSLDYVGVTIVAIWRFFVEVLTNLASRRSLFAIAFLIFMYNFFMRPAQLRQLIADAFFVPVRDACREVWRCVRLIGATLWGHARPGEAIKALVAAILATHLWLTLFSSSGGGELCGYAHSGGGGDTGRIKLDVYS
jgi:hypothetical protein